jgi:hypothetical protein
MRRLLLAAALAGAAASLTTAAHADVCTKDVAGQWACVRENPICVEVYDNLDKWIDLCFV